ncbi:hypothetical protein [Thalassomonas haliotis]|uniref:Uncharacterized protein n=1 Tax=Thalassomonas haliotis TaxID=485448 RepID=A0ABY7VFS6_9GAMM|nr:hypothetical protein [Thalassomonas haliotis]WDE11753.1 hypothetical protein H3N35_26770 [Thalassomonas haliotis]
MAELKRIFSINEKSFINVTESEDGIYELQQFIEKYDSEEEVYYEVRVLPGPTGKYGDLEAAISEAERLMRLN